MTEANTILLVEDDERTRYTYREWLFEAGYEVIEASTKAVALMHLDRMELAAIVLDLVLPNGHGKEVVEALIAKRNDVGVVVVSGFPDSPEFDFPVVSSLRKPFPRGVLLSHLQKAQATSDNFRSARDSWRRLRECINED